MSNPLQEFEDALIASKVAARAKDPAMEVISRSECDEVNKHLAAAQWIVKDWVIRANLSQKMPEEYQPVSPAKLRAITKFRDDLDALAEQVGPHGGSQHLLSGR